MSEVIVACVLNGVLLGAVKLFYLVVPEPMSGLLYCTFLGFTVTYAAGPSADDGKTGICSFLTGGAWTIGYVVLEKLFLLTPLPAVVSCTLAFGIVSFGIEAANILITRNTPFGISALQFAVIIGVFSQKCQHVVYVILAVVIGYIAALISKAIYQKLAMKNNEWRCMTIWEIKKTRK